MTSPLPTLYDTGWGDRWSDCYRLGPSLRHRTRLVRRALQGLTFRSVLDVGCGNGENLAALLAAYPVRDAAGVDVSPVAVQQAKQRLPQAEFQVLDIAAAHLERTYDLVLCCDVLEHIEDDQAAVRHLRAMTRGYLVVTTLQGEMRPWERTIGHVRNYTCTGLEARLRQAGFAPERTIQWGFPFFSPIHRALLQRAGPRISEGRFGPLRRIAAAFVYGLFFLNSSQRGDILVSLARPAP